MNSTRWLTLTDFVKHLGREGHCKVDETPKGWFIALIQRDPMQDLADDKRLKRDRCACCSCLQHPGRILLRFRHIYQKRLVRSSVGEMFASVTFALSHGRQGRCTHMQS